MKNNISLILIGMTLALSLFCESAKVADPKKSKASGKAPLYTAEIPVKSWLRNINVPYSGPEGNFNVLIQIYFPQSYIKEKPVRTLILLPSYGRGLTEWEKNSAAVRYANEQQCVLVCPDMGRTVYESQYFPETTLRWHELPGGVWIPNVLVPFLRDQFGLCRAREITGIAGVGMGARGALLAAARNSEIFSYAGCIAGAYDAALLPQSGPLTAQYGRYKNFKERWESVDSVLSVAQNLKDSCIYMGHGKREKDNPIESAQIVLIKFSQLKKQHPSFNYKFSFSEWGTEWEVWNKLVPDLFAAWSQCGAK
jgi:hypothetical protein